MLEKMWTYLSLTRIYTKPKTSPMPDYEDPVVMTGDGEHTVEDFCNRTSADYQPDHSSTGLADTIDIDVPRNNDAPFFAQRSSDSTESNTQKFIFARGLDIPKASSVASTSPLTRCLEGIVKESAGSSGHFPCLKPGDVGKILTDDHRKRAVFSKEQRNCPYFNRDFD